MAGVDFTAPIALQPMTSEGVDLILVGGGQPVTYHADSRYQVEEFLHKEPRVVVVDGGFFSLESPQFIPGGKGGQFQAQGAAFGGDYAQNGALFTL